MTRRVVLSTARGGLIGLEVTEGLLANIAARIVESELAQAVLAEAHPSETPTLWLKGDHLPGSARWRHTFRRAVGLGVPRLREFAVLEWLRKRAFRCPQPLAAAAMMRGGLVRYQVLALELASELQPLEVCLREASLSTRGAWLDELALEVARMHSLSFVHRDLFLRNVLVDTSPPPPSGDPRRLSFIDAWRSGRTRALRGPEYDIGCLMLDGADDLSPAEQTRFFARYFAERQALETGTDPSSFLRRADAHRTLLARRLEREPVRLRRARAPTLAWDWRSLMP